MKLCLECLLELNFTLDLKWNLYNHTIANEEENGWLFVALQKIPNSCSYDLSLKESDQMKNRIFLPYLGWSYLVLTVQP